MAHPARSSVRGDVSGLTPRVLVWFVVVLAGGCGEIPFVGQPGGAPRHQLPGEFEPVTDVVVRWDGTQELLPYFAELTAAASQRAAVSVLVSSDAQAADVAQDVQEAGGRLDALTLIVAHTDSVWIRDYGPLIVRERGRGRPHVVDFSYFGDVSDDRLPRALAEAVWSLDASELAIELEGGNVLSDGAGSCITSDVVLMRNPNTSEDAIRGLLHHYLGCEALVVVPALADEPTGHVDMFATVVGPKHVLVGRYTIEQDPTNAQRLEHVARQLAAAGFFVERLPMPSNIDGVFRSYANSVAINNSVLVPVYPEAAEHEREALAVFARAYPGRDIVPIISSAIIALNGAVHCTTITFSR